MKTLALVLVAGLTAGCSLGLMAPIVVQGQAFGAAHATQLRAGMSQDEVVALVGMPLRRSTGAPVVWRYEFTRGLRECRLYTGPIPLQSAPIERHVLELPFGVSGLERAMYCEVAPNRSREQMIVGTSATGTEAAERVLMTVAGSGTMSPGMPGTWMADVRSIPYNPSARAVDSPALAASPARCTCFRGSDRSSG